MCLRPLDIFLLAGIDFSRQNLTSPDVRFCRLKSFFNCFSAEKITVSENEISVFQCFVPNRTNICNFLPPEVAGRGSETQLQVVKFKLLYLNSALGAKHNNLSKP